MYIHYFNFNQIYIIRRIFIVINMYHNKMFSPYIADYIDNHFGNTGRLIQRL